MTKDGWNGRRSARQVARVRALQHAHARVAAQAPVELPVAHVHGDHARRAALQEPVHEAAGRTAEVDRVFALDLDLKLPQGVVELVAAARDVAGARGDGDLGVLGDWSAGLVRDLSRDAHLAGEHGGARLGAGREQPPFDEQGIETPTRHDRARPSAPARARPDGPRPPRRPPRA